MMKTMIVIAAMFAALNISAQGLLAPSLESCSSTTSQITWDWSPVSSAHGYKFNTVDDYETATDMDTLTVKIDTGLTCNSPYTRFVWAYNNCGVSPSARYLCFTSDETASAPSEGVHTSSEFSVTWRWLAAAGAVGYKWNTVNNYSTAINKGSGLYHQEYGLQCELSQSSYVWAYDSCGVSSAVELTSSTGPCPGGGSTDCSSFEVSHLQSGGFAPENRTITYAVVTGIPGEADKCWTAQNLGASVQAATVGDTSTNAAGWYFQFNRAQGYKYSGTTRTPSTAWVGYIAENSDWIQANDPCSNELGGDWRIPTKVEWNNVDVAGGWATWTETWSSPLKLHAGGELGEYTGTLGTTKGNSGAFWSSTQSMMELGWRIKFFSSSAYVQVAGKGFGYTLRCIR